MCIVAYTREYNLHCTPTPKKFTLLAGYTEIHESFSYFLAELLQKK